MTNARATAIAVVLALVILCCAAPAPALDQPWISDVFFYWYQWDDQSQWGNWATGGVYYTPIDGYYDSRLKETNRRKIHTSAEWGMTHHFMDYWDPNWQGEGGVPRDRIVMEAAEQVRAAGYPAWMGYYQDGSNFEMREFSRNVAEQRDVYNWLKNYAPFAAWPRLNGYPFQLVYGRNGVPELTIDDAGFRDFVRQRYGSLEAANAAWGADYGDFDDVRMTFDVSGPQRADAIDYQYLLWQQEWSKLDGLVRQQFGYPGIKASFDTGYTPFRGFGFCDFDRVFGGPHSYGGVFGTPHELDVERFIQSIVAKRYDTVFFDHLKGYYCDWNTLGRIPGTQYPADPFAYDRFWVGDLMRYNEAVLHLSWNEWWEGSNLEPSLELGKEYCEKNLFYSTIMQLCFPSLRDFGKGASAAVLLNDWAFKCGTDHPKEIYTAIQMLRRSMVPFDLVVDDQVTAETLRRFTVVFAPAAGVGFGRNARGEAIAPILAQWAQGAPQRRLVTSDCQQLRQLFGLTVKPTVGSASPGRDLSVFVDIGEPDDERYLLSGYSGREEWSQLPADAYGRSPEKYTVRWTPASSTSLRLLLPVSPNRNHVLRFSGSALQPNEIAVHAGGQIVDRVQIEEGVHDYRAHIPASAVGARHFLEVEFAFAQTIIPGELDPAKFPGEQRICDLALDWVQISTANLDFSREQIYEPPSARVDFASPIYAKLAGQSRESLPAPRDVLVARDGAVTARYRAGAVPRDLMLVDGRVLYVNGQMDDVAPDEWIPTVLTHWAGAEARTRVMGDSIMGAALRSDNTVILLVYNYDPSEARSVDFTVEALGRPVAQVAALRRDGDTYRPVSWRTDGTSVRFSDTLRYFGVYEVVFAPVRIDMGRVVAHPGESLRLPISVTAGDAPAEGAVSFVSVAPSIAMSGPPLPFRAQAGETIRMEIPISVRADADWGEKTVALRVETGRSAAWALWPLEVQPGPDVIPAATIVDGRLPRLTLTNAPPPGAKTCARATGVTVEAAGQSVNFGDIEGGGKATRTLAVTQPFAGRPRLAELPVTVSYDQWGRQVAKTWDLDLAVVPSQAPGPPEALAAAYVFNSTDEVAENYPITLTLPSSLGTLAERLYVEDEEGRPLPTQVDADGELSFIGRLPAASPATFYVMLAPTISQRPTAAGDMELTVEPLSRLSGTVRLANSRLSAVVSAPRGGTLASLRSQATGREYAADSLGIAYGTWSRPVDVKSPARQPQGLIAEQRVRQCDSPAQVEILATGPVRAAARVTWDDGRVRCRETYELRAFQPYIRVTSDVTPAAGFAAQELVLLDGRFNSNGLKKISPGFSGMLGEFDDPHPHFGWREAGYVPRVATMMELPPFAESLSLILTETGGADWWRQGFWPENRPEPGPCKYAWCELVSRSGRGGKIEAYLLLHGGNQAVAQKFQREIGNPPLAAVVEISRDANGTTEPHTATYPANWWSPYWPVRVPAHVVAPADASLPAAVTTTISLPGDLASRGGQGEVDAMFVRVVEVDDRGRPVAALPAMAALSESGLAVSWQVLPISPWRGDRDYFVYLDVGGGPHAPETGRLPGVSAAAVDPSLEQKGRYWALEGTARWSNDDARSGRVSARLESDGRQGLGLLAAPGFPAASNSSYRVSFWAKAVAGEGLLRVNFFIDGAHDYGQQEVHVPADGQWHQFDVVAPTGSMPAGALPALRIWAIARKQVTLVDDVAVEMPRRARLTVTVGKPEIP